MNPKTTLLVLLALIVIGAGAFALTRTAQAPGGSDTAAVQGGSTTLKALLAAGIPQKCDFTDSTDGTETSGTVYVSGGKARSDVKATASGQTFTMHTLVEGDTMHSWIDETKMGMKMMNTSADTQSSNQSFDASKTLEYRCGAWVPDSSKFTLPTDITFTTFTPPTSVGGGAGVSGSAGAAVQGSAGAPANACSACDSVPEAYRAQCKEAAGC
jgi:hypothetical protein